MDDFRRQFTWGAVALVVVGAVIAAVVTPLGEKFVDWALPTNTAAPVIPQGTMSQSASAGGPGNTVSVRSGR
jgi:hypothetical protein